MKIGAIFPTTEIGNDPAVIRDWAQTAEGLGYSHITFFDHVLGAEHADRTPPLAGPYTEHHPFHEPFVVMSFIAAVTSRIELATGILILPQRQTVLVAKQAAELDVLSGGRLRLGVGSGWNHVEYESLGADYGSRGRRMDEQVELMRRLWREPVVDFRGEFHRVDRAGLLPQPRAELPVWFGGFSEVAFRRAARLGDGFIYGSRPTRMTPMIERVQALLRENGRDPASFGGDAAIDFSSPRETWRDEIRHWKALGGTHISLRAMDTAAEFVGERTVGYQTPQSYIDALQTFITNANSGDGP
ncbi:MAG: LLM class F420-dependent oxidoreductase [Deltaproteobacteria bacterium]|nr:LLM class F420-dependent oxidoreductase [Deltaproteobacteria bacterium]